VADNVDPLDVIHRYLRVGAALSAIRGLAAIDAALAGLLLDAVPVERVVIAGADGDAPAVQSAWSTHASSEPVAIDSSLLERVIRERVAIVIDLADRHAVAVPLVAFGRAVGIVWAETGRGGRLDERHVRMLLIIAALAAVTREHARETARLQETNEIASSPPVSLRSRTTDGRPRAISCAS
jgi:GAF domain-containing protein